MFLDWDALNSIVQALGWALIHFLWQGALIAAFFALGMRVLRDSAPTPRYWFGLICMLALAVSPIVTVVVIYPGISQANVLPTYAIEAAVPLIVVAWVFGVAVHSARVFSKWRGMRQLTRVGVRKPARQILDQAAALQALFGIRRAVAILESSLVEVPTVMGWLKPVILLPTASLIGLSPRQLELVIAHELSHVRRWDYLINLFQVCIETMLFYHPVVRWISGRVREEREKCCDDLVVETCGNRLEYAKALTNLESIRSGELMPALHATDGKLFERIERIVCSHAREHRDAVAGNAIFLVIIALTFLAAGRLADPLGAFEAKRTRIGDALVNELLLATVPQQSQILLAPLENARFTHIEPGIAETANTTPSMDALLERTAASLSLARETAGPDDETVAEAVAETPVGERAGRGANAAFLADSGRPRAAKWSGSRDQAAPAERRSTVPAPEVLIRVAPQFPLHARLSGQSGYVEVAFSVTADGKPTGIEIVDSQPQRVFELAVVRAIKRWRFDPTSVAEVDVKRIVQRFDFNLVESQSDVAGPEECLPVTGSRLCNPEKPAAPEAREVASP